jgi:hypothetical protein
VYWIDEVHITDLDLCRAMLDARKSSQELGLMAMADFERGGRGRANTVFSAPLDKIRAAFLKLPPEDRDDPIEFEGVVLSSNVPAILAGVEAPKFEWLSQE